MRVLVTGGGGFLGSGIVDRLLQRGDTVVTLNRSHYPGLEEKGVDQVLGDISDGQAVNKAAEGCDLVFHTAAKAGVWGDLDSYYRPNVLGTQHVISACRKHGIRFLVHTSSPSVTFDGSDQVGVDETEPYPDKFMAFYPQTKAEAEKLVNAADGELLRTTSLRPHLIWGPGDNHLVPRIVARAKAGKLKLVGGGRNKVDSVYIDNAVDAHLAAADVLIQDGPVCGKNYFISNDEPMAMADLLNGILKAAGLPPVRKSVSPGLARFAGALLETVYGVMGKEDEPMMTRFVAGQLATDHWFDLSAAKEDFGYKPKVSMAEGFQRLEAAFKAGAFATTSG